MLLSILLPSALAFNIGPPPVAVSHDAYGQTQITAATIATRSYSVQRSVSRMMTSQYTMTAPSASSYCNEPKATAATVQPQQQRFAIQSDDRVAHEHGGGQRYACHRRRRYDTALGEKSSVSSADDMLQQPPLPASSSLSAMETRAQRWCDRGTSAFPAWVLGAAMLGLWRPKTMAWFGGDLITGALATTMVRKQLVLMILTNRCAIRNIPQNNRNPSTGEGTTCCNIISGLFWLGMVGVAFYVYCCGLVHTSEPPA